jgi:hypothetical protein
MCPNLVHLNIGVSQFTENPEISLSADNFRSLKSLEITMYDFNGYQMPLSVLEHILRAENLEHIYLYFVKSFPKALLNVLSENNVAHFQKLKSVCLERIGVKNYTVYISSLKKLISRSPCLNNLEIMCMGDGVDKFKKSGIKQFCEQIPGLKLTTDYGDFGIY